MALISAAKRAANRANAQRSTGPRTEAGKTVVRFNAVKHGLCAEQTVLPGEDAAAFEDLRADVLAQLRPAGKMQREVAERAARELWRLRRARVAETGTLRLIASPYAIQAKQADAAPEQAELFAVSQAFSQDFRDEGFLEKLSRWEARCARGFERCVRLLRLLQRSSPAEMPSPALREREGTRAQRGEGEGQGTSPSRSPSSALRPGPHPSPLPQGREREADSQFPAGFGFVPPPFADVREAALGGVSQVALALARLLRTPEIGWPAGLAGRPGPA